MPQDKTFVKILCKLVNLITLLLLNSFLIIKLLDLINELFGASIIRMCSFYRGKISEHIEDFVCYYSCF